MSPVNEDGSYREVTNEDRADWGSNIAMCSPDWGQNDLQTDLTDALADVIHFLHRAGYDPRFMFDAALESARGDLEDGPEAEWDPKLSHGGEDG